LYVITILRRKLKKKHKKISINMMIYRIAHLWSAPGKGHKFRITRFHWPWLVRTTATLAIPFRSECVPITRPIFQCCEESLSSRTSTIVPITRFGPLEFGPAPSFACLQRTLQVLAVPELLRQWCHSSPPRQPIWRCGRHIALE